MCGRHWLHLFQAKQVTMKTPTTQTRHVKSIISQPLLALAAASVISALAMAPALAEDYDNRQGNWNHGRGNGGYNDNGHGYRGDWHGYRGDWHGYQPPYYYRRPSHPHAYLYAPPPVYYALPPVYYAPPPVYYAPVPSPGINLVFPIDIR